MQESCKQYWRRREELTVEADCILLGTRVVVPMKLREVVLQELHKGHQGVARMKAKARSQVWWPGLDHEIEQLARCCSACVNVKSVPPHCMLHPWVWPTRAWSRIHVDYVGPIFGKTYLVIVDAYTKSPRWPPPHPPRQFQFLNTYSVCMWATRSTRIRQWTPVCG